MYTIETEISDELLTQIDERVENVHAQSRADYILRLIKKDIATAKSEDSMTLREILAPVHADSAGMSEQEIEDFGKELIAKVRAERREKASSL